jgi:hypothetical protein
MWSHQVTRLWVVLGSFCPWSRLLLGPVVTHCQFVQSVQSCCFYQVAAALPTAATLLAPPPAGWDNSILYPTLSLRRPAQWSTTGPALGGWLFTPSPAVSLCVLPYLCLLLVWLLWDVGFLPTPALSLCYFSHLCSVRVSVLTLPPLSPGKVQHSTPQPMLVLDYNSLFIFFSFVVWGGFSLFRGCTGLCSWGVGRGVSYGVCYSSVHSAGLWK